MYRPTLLVFFLYAFLLPVAAWSQVVDLELVLAVDVSGSIDSQEANLQRQGYTAAVTNPRIISAIQSGATGRIALTYLEWADDYQQTIVDWQLIDSRGHPSG